MTVDGREVLGSDSSKFGFKEDVELVDGCRSRRKKEVCALDVLGNGRGLQNVDREELQVRRDVHRARTKDFRDRNSVRLIAIVRTIKREESEALKEAVENRDVRSAVKVGNSE